MVETIKGKGAATPILELRAIGKSFASGLTALAGVDLTVARGEFVSLLGPSGCGKSTLLRIVAGLTPPSAGTCHVALADGPTHRIPAGRIGFVFQDPTLMPWSTVTGNVLLPFRIALQVGSPQRERVAASIRAVTSSVLAPYWLEIAIITMKPSRSCVHRPLFIACS